MAAKTTNKSRSRSRQKPHQSDDVISTMLMEEASQRRQAIESLIQEREPIEENLRSLDARIQESLSSIDTINHHLRLEGHSLVDTSELNIPNTVTDQQNKTSIKTKSTPTKNKASKTDSSTIPQQVAVVLDMFDHGVLEDGRSKDEIAESAQNKYNLRPSKSNDITTQMFLHINVPVKAGIVARTGRGKYSITKKGYDAMNKLSSLEDRVEKVRSFYNS